MVSKALLLFQVYRATSAAADGTLLTRRSIPFFNQTFTKQRLLCPLPLFFAHHHFAPDTCTFRRNKFLSTYTHTHVRLTCTYVRKIRNPKFLIQVGAYSRSFAQLEISSCISPLFIENMCYSLNFIYSYVYACTWVAIFHESAGTIVKGNTKPDNKRSSHGK